MITTDIQAQQMLKKIHKSGQKINVGLGFRAGEPTGINLQFFKGETASVTKSRNIIDVNFGKEGAVYNKVPKYKTGEWRPGGNRITISWLREVNHKLFGQYLHIGVGLQGGSRQYQVLAKTYKENFTWGPQVLLHGELPLFTLTITPSYLYCKITAFAEGTYYREFGEPYSYVRPSAGIRVNFFY